MKEYTFSELLNLLGGSALTVILGAVLLLSPDTASALVGNVLGWVIVLAALMEAFRREKKSPVAAIILGVLGVLILRDPLYVAKAIGRILGLAFFIWGLGSFRRNYRGSMTARILAAGAVAVLGVVLFLLPMTATRLVLKVAGIVIICIGLADGYDRLKGRKRLESAGDPDIIDVEKL